jgi:hypothetical protein
MPSPRRLFDVRLLVLATIDINADELADALKAANATASSLADVVAAEVTSNLESVPYVVSAVVVRV